MSGRDGAERSDKVGSLTAGVLTRQLERMRPALIEPAPEVSKSPAVLKSPRACTRRLGEGEFESLHCLYAFVERSIN